MNKRSFMRGSVGRQAKVVGYGGVILAEGEVSRVTFAGWGDVDEDIKNQGYYVGDNQVPLKAIRGVEARDSTCIVHATYVLPTKLEVLA